MFVVTHLPRILPNVEYSNLTTRKYESVTFFFFSSSFAESLETKEAIFFLSLPFRGVYSARGDEDLFF